MYSKKIIQMFQNPKFVGTIKNYSGKGRTGNPKCGDIMEVYIKVEKKKNKEIIKDIKFKTFGCVAAIASSEALCRIVKGKTIQKALKVTKKDIVKSMGKVPLIKVHCSVLASEALKKAIQDYKRK